MVFPIFLDGHLSGYNHFEEEGFGEKVFSIVSIFLLVHLVYFIGTFSFPYCRFDHLFYFRYYVLQIGKENTMIILFLLLQEQNSNGFFSSITASHIITFLGMLGGGGWGYYQFKENKKLTLAAADREDERDDDKNNRQETKEIIEIYKGQLNKLEQKYDALVKGYEILYTDKMAIQIEVAVISYEHELLYSKLTPEESAIVRQRVSIFKNSLTSIAADEKISKDLKAAIEK